MTSSRWWWSSWTSLHHETANWGYKLAVCVPPSRTRTRLQLCRSTYSETHNRWLLCSCRTQRHRVNANLKEDLGNKQLATRIDGTRSFLKAARLLYRLWKGRFFVVVSTSFHCRGINKNVGENKIFRREILLVDVVELNALVTEPPKRIQK